MHFLIQQCLVLRFVKQVVRCNRFEPVHRKAQAYEDSMCFLFQHIIDSALFITTV